MTKPWHEMTPAERTAARIAKNREIEDQAKQIPVLLNLQEIIEVLNSKRQRATYGAVAGILGRPAQSLMSGRTKCQPDSWVVASTGPGRGWPTEYAEAEIHPECLRQIRVGNGNILDDAEDLRRWLRQQ